jgi:hypothetical protein
VLSELHTKVSCLEVPLSFEGYYVYAGSFKRVMLRVVNWYKIVQSVFILEVGVYSEMVIYLQNEICLHGQRVDAPTRVCPTYLLHLLQQQLVLQGTMVLHQTMQSTLQIVQ